MKDFSYFMGLNKNIDIKTINRLEVPVVIQSIPINPLYYCVKLILSKICMENSTEL